MKSSVPVGGRPQTTASGRLQLGPAQAAAAGAPVPELPRSESPDLAGEGDSAGRGLGPCGRVGPWLTCVSIYIDFWFESDSDFPIN